MQSLTVLVLGSGGREHALAWKLSQSPLCGSLHVAPGNPGIATFATCHPGQSLTPDDVLLLAEKIKPDLVVVGPEAPLVAGVVDRLEEASFRIFGPTSAAAQLESSKAFTKDLCREAAIPTAAYSVHDAYDSAQKALKNHGLPVVIKADGLAAGKGVVIAETSKEAEEALSAIFKGRFGDAGTRVVIEDYLRGEEASLFMLCDGEQALCLGTAQDHKRLLEEDRGPNTGGMGAYSPAPVLTPELINYCEKTIISPTLQTMKARGMPFRGFLYAGLMITDKEPYLIEYNVRFGDPECQVIMPRLDNDLLALLMASVTGDLAKQEISLASRHALTVVLAAPGYPDKPVSGGLIGLPIEKDESQGIIFHAGTQEDESGLKVAGGRVLNATGWGESLVQAQSNAYHLVDKIDFKGKQYRKDIGWRAL